MTEQMTEQFNLDDVFGQLEADTKFESVLHFLKKGEQVLLAMLPPLPYNNKPVLAINVEGEYRGKPTKQHIMRFILFPMINGKPDTENYRYVGIALPPTLIQQIVKAYQGEYQLAKQECHFIELSKAEKQALTFRPTIKKIPDEIWLPGLTTPSWEELIKAHESMKENVAAKTSGGKKEESKDETPWG